MICRSGIYVRQVVGNRIFARLFSGGSCVIFHPNRLFSSSSVVSNYGCFNRSVCG